MQYGGFSTKGWQRANVSLRYIEENIQKKCYNLLGSGTQLVKVNNLMRAHFLWLFMSGSL